MATARAGLVAVSPVLIGIIPFGLIFGIAAIEAGLLTRVFPFPRAGTVLTYVWTVLLYFGVMTGTLIVQLLYLSVLRGLAHRVRRHDLLPTLRILARLLTAATIVFSLSWTGLLLLGQRYRWHYLPGDPLRVALPIAGLAAMAGTVALIVALIWMAVCLLRLAGTFRDIPGHLVRAGYILERSEASASDAPKTPPQDAGRFPPDAGLAAGAILADLPCVTCGTELRGCLISDGCSECSSPVEDSLLVLPQPDATRLAIRLAPWAILFWLFTTVTGPFSAAAAGLMLYCSHRLARRCELDRMPAMARPVGELWWAARVGLVVVVIFSLVDTPWYFSSENAQPIREHGAGRSLHLVGSLCVYIAGLGVTFWFLSVCRGLARRARRQSLATSFTVVKYLFLTGLAASWGALAARDLPGSYDHGRLLGYSSVGWHTVGELAGVPGGIWAVCVLVASIWLIVSAYRLSHALRDAPRDWSRVVRGDSEPHRPVRRYNTPRTREAGPE